MNEIRNPTNRLDPARTPAKPAPAAGRTDVDASAAAPRVRPPFRSRLLAVLILFAVVPSLVVTVAWVVTTSRTLPLVGATSAWERVGESGERVVSVLSDAPLTDAQREALATHEAELRRSVEMAKRFGFMVPRTVQLVALGALVLLVAVALGASRVAGHLARQLSRPLDELVGWTGLLRAGEPLPTGASQRGAPEFAVLRSGMRSMAEALEAGRAQALAAERAEAFRESARRFAHELKNPLTPIRFAVARLRRDAPASLHETVDVLAEESARLDTMARAFAQFGRLPDGTPSDIDVGELVQQIAQATVPDHLQLTVEVDPGSALVHGFHDPLARAVGNVLINAVEACAASGSITVRVHPDTLHGAPAVCIRVHDSGPGMEAAVLARMFDPYVTSKPGGTGLGLAIARQTVAAHHGVLLATSTPGNGTDVRFCLPTFGVAAPAGTPSSGAIT